MIIELVTPGGIVVPLEDPANGFMRTGPVDGVGMPPVDITSTPIYAEPGDWLNGLRYKPRDVHVPLSISTDQGLDDLLRIQRRLLSLLAPSTSPTRNHTLRFTLDDGSAREINCRYSDGWSGSPPQYDSGADEWMEDVVTFHCVDPMFYDVDDNEFTASSQGSRAFFPMFDDPANVGPHFSSSNVFGDFTVTNNGDLVAWPVITVVGPGTDLRIVSGALGTIIDMSAHGGITLNAGQSITIDTRPGYVSVTLNDGTNVFDLLTDDSTIWPLALGEQIISVDMGSTTPDSAITVKFRQRYLTI